MKTYRNLQNNQPLRNRLPRSQCLQRQHPNRRQRQQQTHLDIQTRGIQECADIPLSALITVDSREQEEHGEAVVEAAEYEDGVQALGEDEEGEEVGWCLV